MTVDLLNQMQSVLGRDLIAFAPELIVCIGIVVLLLLRLFSAMDRLHLGIVAFALGVVALFVSVMQWRGDASFDPRQYFAQPVSSLDLFTGLLIYDNFTIFLKVFLLAFFLFMVVLTLLTRIPDREDSGDFYVLLMGATIGMMLMASANHLLMIFMAVEMASLPSYAMAGFLKGKRQSSEAALKYVVYGGGAAGVMLYGMSILAGKFGTAYLPDLAAGLVAMDSLDPMLILGVLFILIGFAFKLSAVPFHFWCPDVFEGAAAEVAGFLSVASKGAALALTARFAFVLGGLSGDVFNQATWEKVVPYLVPALSVMAIVTATFGNLAALAQMNLKRLLAYSTIAQAGYMIMGIATMTKQGVAAVLFYLVAYLFMNLGAFAIVAFIRNLTGSEELSDHRGLVNRAPILVVALAVCLLSLLGMPPLVGFIAKFQVFWALYDAGVIYGSPAVNQPSLAALMYSMLFVLGINSVISLVYYVKVLKVMIMDKPLEEVEERESPTLPATIPARLFAGFMSVAIFVLGIQPQQLTESTRTGVRSFQSMQTATAKNTPNGRVAQEQRP